MTDAEFVAQARLLTWPHMRARLVVEVDNDWQFVSIRCTIGAS